MDQPQQRAQAVRATIGASTSLLDPGDADRFTELGVFAEDEVIPLRLVARLWQVTAGLENRDELRAAQICERLAQLALVSHAAGPAPGITVHDVVRDFLRADLGPQRLADLTGKLLAAVARDLSAASPLGPGWPAVSVAWWELSPEDRYLWDHMIEHLVDAEGPDAAGAVAGDLRWAGARLERFGPAAPAADLAVVGTPRTARLQAVLARSAHLLAPAQPSRAVVDVLHSRVADDPDWGPQAAALRDISPRPRLVSRWPLPDLADPAARRVLAGHAVALEALAVAPDGSWLASAGRDGTVRIWDPASGRDRATLTGHQGRVGALAVAPDGSWLASAGRDGTVRIWDPASGRDRATLTGHQGAVAALAVAPDGSWLASAGRDGTVRIWDPASGRDRATLTGHQGAVAALAVAPDGSWLASAGRDGTVRIWDPASTRDRATLTGHPGAVAALAVAPDGSWLASAGRDGTVRIWDPASTRDRATLTGHPGAVAALAVAPDGSWLASAGRDGTVRIWDPASTRDRATLTGHPGAVAALAVAPDGSWLASASEDGTVRIWDPASTRDRATLTGHPGAVAALAVAPDGSWLASASEDGTVRIWDPASTRDRATLTGHPGAVAAVAALAVAPDGSWLASASEDGTVRIWDPASGLALAFMRLDSRAYRSAALGRFALAVGSSAGLCVFDLLVATDSVSIWRGDGSGIDVAEPFPGRSGPATVGSQSGYVASIMRRCAGLARRLGDLSKMALGGSMSPS